MDLKMARHLGLPVRLAKQGDCGQYGVPGSGLQHDYAGVIMQPFVLRLGEKVQFVISGMRVIDHPYPLFLLGSDILCIGRKPPSWEFGGVILDAAMAGVNRTGKLCFTRGTEVELAPLAQVARAPEV